jgi:hypothetical protein
MKKVILAMSCAVLLVAAPLAAQTGSGLGSGSGRGGDDQTKVQEADKKAAEAVAVTTKIAEAQSRPGPRFVMTLTNVQIELTISDQVGTQTPEKKTVNMVVASGNWGKIRSTGNVRPPGETPLVVQLDVDARPLVSVDGPIQLELTLNYAPPGLQAAERDNSKPRPTNINQSLTVVLQSGKPLIVSQAADPVSERKVVVEVKATVLK